MSVLSASSMVSLVADTIMSRGAKVAGSPGCDECGATGDQVWPAGARRNGVESLSLCGEGPSE